MGFYLQTPEIRDKAAQLMQMYGAKEITPEAALSIIMANDMAPSAPDKKAVVVVVRNPRFDAAAYCYSIAEYRRFHHPLDDRPQTWLLFENGKMVEELSGYTQIMEDIQTGKVQ